MRSQAYQQQADRIVAFYKKFSPSRRETYKHFMDEEIPKSTIATVLNRFEKTGTSTYSKERGPKAVVTSEKQVSKVKDYFGKLPEASVRDGAKNLRMTPSSVSDCRKKAGIRSKVTKTVPKRTEDHENRCQAGAKKLLRKLGPKSAPQICIVDDECYCYADPNQIPQKRFVSIVPGHTLTDKQKTTPKGKFEKKYGVWQALASDGKASPPVIIKGTMNSKKYLRYCLKAVLVPWIESNYSIENCILWPDLATYHYGPKTLAFLEEKNLKIVPKDENTPNLPECRPIERFWALVKREMTHYKNPAKTARVFRSRWEKCYQRVIERSGETLFSGFKKKLQICAKSGPLQISTANIRK